MALYLTTGFRGQRLFRRNRQQHLVFSLKFSSITSDFFDSNEIALSEVLTFWFQYNLVCFCRAFASILFHTLYSTFKSEYLSSSVYWPWLYKAFSASRFCQSMNLLNLILKSGKLDREKSTQSFNAEFLPSTPLVVNIVFFVSARFQTSKIILVIQPTISLEMPVPSQGHYGFHSFPVVDWFCVYIL